jgi:Zn-dependent protease
MAEWRRWFVGVYTILGIGLAELRNTWLVEQLFTTAGSMLVSLLVYAYTFGWQFAAGFVFLLLAHEWGHVLAIRMLGLGARGPLFIPFFGAVVQLRSSPVNVKGDAGIAIAGPALGTLSALVCLVIYLWVDYKIWLVLSYTGCVLNLFNLIPCSPLDGGRIAPAISPNFWVVGLLVLGGIFLETWNPFLLLILTFAVVRMWRLKPEDIPNEYFFIAPFMRLRIALWYFGILSVLAVATVFTHSLLQ